MAMSNQAVNLTVTLPEHVLTVIDGWAAVELQATPEEVLEAMAEELCTSEEQVTSCAPKSPG
jgi:hypothetical protein